MSIALSTQSRSMSGNISNPNLPREPISDALEPHFAPAEIAQRLHLSEQTVIRMFQDQPGVFKLRRGFGKKRDYVTLRIPESVLRKVVEGRSR